MTTSNRRTMIVTGASSGIGQALAVQAADTGWAVLLVARRGDRLEHTQRDIRARDGSAATLAIDVTANDASQRIVDAAIKHFGRIDVVVNNAGNAAPGNLLEQSDAAIDAQWNLHVTAPLRLSRAALPQVRAHGGQLVFVGSGVARVPVPGFGAYCAAKAAVRAAAVQLRRELRSDGVSVMYVDPGAVDTEFSSASGMERSSSNIYLGTAQDVARAMLRGIERRRTRVNAQPLHTAGSVLGEWFPVLADAVIARVVDHPAALPSEEPSSLETFANQTPAVEPTATPLPATTPAPMSNAGDNGAIAGSDFETALAGVSRRMERVKLAPSFVRGLLVPGERIDLHDVAMRWAGMPNKNERAAMHEVLDALATAGYLQPSGDETWTVLRAAD